MSGSEVHFFLDISGYHRMGCGVYVLSDALDREWASWLREAEYTC